MKRIALIVLTSVGIISCGGGGGGGAGPSEPASLSTAPPATNTVNIKRGIFTDGPVEGLKYKQGSLNGITNALGEFEYDANSNTPVTFSVGSIELGSAMGGDVITPYDLSVGGKSNSLQSGFNISRFLLSMDTEPEQNIQLPDSDGIVGEFDFSTTTQAFEQNEPLNALVKIYGAGELESVNDTEMHLALNPAIAESKLKLTSSIEKAITDIQLSWDPALANSGVLLKAEANDESLFFVEASIDEENGGLNLTRVSLFYNHGSYLVFDVNAEVEPTLVSNSGDVKLFANFAYMDVERLMRIETFSPTREGALLDESGYLGRITLPPIGKAIRFEILELLEKYNGEGFSNADVIQLAQKLLSISELLVCGGSDAVCSIDLAQAFTYSLDDESYFTNVVAIQQGSLEPFCVPFETGLSLGSACNTYLSQVDFSDLVGVQFINSSLTVPKKQFASVYAYFYMNDLHDSYHTVDGYLCNVDLIVESYGDYIQYSSAGSYSCFWEKEPRVGKGQVLPANWPQRRAALELFADRYLKDFFEILELATMNPAAVEHAVEYDYVSISTPNLYGYQNWHNLNNATEDELAEAKEHYFTISDKVDSEGLDFHLSSSSKYWNEKVSGDGFSPLVHWLLPSGQIESYGSFMLIHGSIKQFFDMSLFYEDIPFPSP